MARCHALSTSRVKMCSTTAVPPTVSGERIPKSGNSSATITGESPNQSSTYITLPFGSRNRSRCLAPKARWYNSDAATASWTTMCGVIVCIQAGTALTSVICRPPRPPRPGRLRRCPRQPPVVDQPAVVAVHETGTGAEVVREAELDAGELFEPVEFVERELDRERTESVLELAAATGTDYRHDHAACLLGAHPGDRDLRWACASLGGHRVDGVGDLKPAFGQLALPVCTGRRDARVLGAVAIGAVPSGEKASPERPPCCHRQLERLRHRQQLTLDSPVDEAVRDLQPGEARPAAQIGERDRLRDDPRRGVRDPDIEHLAGPDDVVERAHELLDRRVRIPDVDPVHVDVVGAEPLEARVERLDHALAVRSPAVRVARVHVQRVLRR